MTARTIPAAAVAALLTAGPVHAQEPAPTQETSEATPRIAVPRAGRERAAEPGGERRTGNVRAPRPERVAGAPRSEAAAAPEPATAEAADQGGRRRPPSGGSTGGSIRGGGRGDGAGSAGTARPRSGGVRAPDVDRDGGSRAQAIPRSRAPRPSPPVIVNRDVRRYYYGPSGFGYYFYDPWSWYGYGWPGYAGWGGWGWGGYYGNVPYYGGAYGGYGGYGATYAGPYGWSIGSVRLKVKPRDAEVYVDGYYAGIVDDFDGIWQRLRLDDGGHRIEIRKPGLQPLTFDVMVQPGRTVTYRGDLTQP
jgi:hypothetical protein